MTGWPSSPQQPASTERGNCPSLLPPICILVHMPTAHTHQGPGPCPSPSAVPAPAAENAVKKRLLMLLYKSVSAVISVLWTCWLYRLKKQMHDRNEELLSSAPELLAIQAIEKLRIKIQASSHLQGLSLHPPVHVISIWSSWKMKWVSHHLLGICFRKQTQK